MLDELARLRLGMSEHSLMVEHHYVIVAGTGSSPAVLVVCDNRDLHYRSCTDFPVLIALDLAVDRC